MNIFYLDKNIVRCAAYHADKHVIKMILESAQILATVVQLYGLDAPYKKTHINHPCALWAAESIENWKWLRRLNRYLNEEYMYRWHKDRPHKSFVMVQSLKIPNRLMPNLGITPRPQVMPQKYIIQNDPVQAYRNYYSNEKRHILRYTTRLKPIWLLQDNHR